MNPRDLMDQLVAERRRRGWTQQHIASRCGVNRTAVCRWETEETRTPRLTTVIAYAQALGMRLAFVPNNAHVIIEHRCTCGRVHL